MGLQEDYRAIRDGAAIGAVAPRAQIALKGQDRAAYLQGLLTNDIPAVPAGAGCYAAWLTPQGRMITDLHVLAGPDMLLLDVPAALASDIQQRLDQFLFSEDVQIVPLAGSLDSIWLHGPQAARVIQHVTGVDVGEWPDYRHAPLEYSGAPVVVARIDQLGVPGFCLYADPSQTDSLRAALQDAGAALVAQDAIDAARVEQGYPVFGTDMTDETIPLEAQIESRAISFTKGCYVGQEVVIRVLHRGGGRVAKKLVGLRMTGGDVRAGDRISANGRDIGFITSAALSPASGPIALGYVHRDFVDPGTAVTVGQDAVSGIVTARPMTSAA